MEVLDIIPLSAAARRVGVSYQWLRTLVERSRVLSRKDVDGRVYISLEEVKRLSAVYGQRRSASLKGSPGA